MVAVAPILKVGYFASELLSLGKLGSLVVKLTYLSHVSAASFDSLDPEMATIVHRVWGDYPRIFVA